MSVNAEEAAELVHRLRQVSREEFDYEGRDSFWSLLAEEAADMIASLVLTQSIKTFLYEGEIKHDS